jgi:hypothetical protein
VADSCDDGNAWCENDPYHVDLAQTSLNNSILNGQPVSQSGATVSATNASYDGAIAPGGSATWGRIVSGSNQLLSGLSCTLS